MNVTGCQEEVRLIGEEAGVEVRLEREADGQRGEPQEKSHARNQQEDPVFAFHGVSRSE